MTRSGFCSRCPREGDDLRGPTHTRCRLEGCRCEGHDQDTRDAAAALVEESTFSDEPVLDPDLIHRLARLLYAAETIGSVPDDMAADDGLRALGVLRSALSALRDLDAALVRHIYVNGEHGDVQVEGLPVAKVTRARDRKAWEHRPLAQAVLDAHLTERGFEQPDPWEAITWVLDAAGVSYWKVTALRELGIDADQYCETTPGKPQVQFIE